MLDFRIYLSFIYKGSRDQFCQNLIRELRACIPLARPYSEGKGGVSFSLDRERKIVPWNYKICKCHYSLHAGHGQVTIDI